MCPGHRKAVQREFSASPRVATFLTVASRHQVTLHHLAGSANIPSDFASRNEPTCSLGESWIKHELEEEQGFFVDSGALTCSE